MDTWNPQEQLPSLSSKLPSESLLKDVNAAPLTIPTVTIMLIYATATVILEMLGYNLNKTRKRQCPSCRRRLEARIKATQGEFSLLSELQKGNTKKDLHVPKTYSKLSISEAMETAKLMLKALTTRLKGYT